MRPFITFSTLVVTSGSLKSHINHLNATVHTHKHTRARARSRKQKPLKQKKPLTFSECALNTKMLSTAHTCEVNRLVVV